MGSFHCIPSGCAQIFYREYRAGRLEYQYPNEPKQVIIGNNLTYTTQQAAPPFIGGQCAVNYDVAIRVDICWDGTTTVSEVINTSMRVRGPITGVLSIFEDSFNYYVRVHCALPGCCVSSCTSYPSNLFATRNVWQKGYSRYARNPRIISVTRVDGQPDNCGNLPTNCTFRVFKAGTQIFTRTASVCPTVEQFPPTLDEKSKSVIISKFPFLERVEVIDYGYERLGLNLFRSDIPDNCLNIYVNGVTALIPPPILPVPFVAGNYNFVIQICSDDDSPPPEYEVICDCDCKSCPPNTCAVFCEDVVCCYDENGTAVETISINEYCGY